MLSDGVEFTFRLLSEPFSHCFGTRGLLLVLVAVEPEAAVALAAGPTPPLLVLLLLLEFEFKLHELSLVSFEGSSNLECMLRR